MFDSFRGLFDYSNDIGLKYSFINCQIPSMYLLSLLVPFYSLFPTLCHQPYCSYGMNETRPRDDRQSISASKLYTILCQTKYVEHAIKHLKHRPLPIPRFFVSFNGLFLFAPHTHRLNEPFICIPHKMPCNIYIVVCTQRVDVKPCKIMTTFSRKNMLLHSTLFALCVCVYLRTFGEGNLLGTLREEEK